VSCPMKRTWTILLVGDVPGSCKRFEALLGQHATLPARHYFGQIPDSDGAVLLCLDECCALEHPSLMSRDHGTPGNGLPLFFRVDDFHPALRRARSLVTRLEAEPRVNPNTQSRRSGWILSGRLCANGGSSAVAQTLGAD
jgi:hypothetical protein